MYFGLLPWATLYNDIIWTYRITGRPFSLGNAEHSYHSRREFNGDGYSIDVYLLSEGVAKHFETPPPEFFEKRPERSDVRSHWEAVTWRKTPSRPEDMDYIHFVSIYPGEAGRHDKKGQDVAASLLSEAGNYYAYFHHGDIGDVDLFILSPRRRLFVIVNQNT